MEKTIRIIICDDSVEYCENLDIYLSMQTDFKCIGVANDSDMCISLARDIKPDLFLIDIQMESRLSGIGLLIKLKSLYPTLPVIMLTGHKESKYVFLSLVNGADGYVIKDIDIRKMFDEIKDIYQNINKKNRDEIMQLFIDEAGNMYHSKAMLLNIISLIVKLSGTEYDILRDIYNGMTYRQIAEKRFVEEGTVKTQAARIIKKFEMKSMRNVIAALKEVNFFENF